MALALHLQSKAKDLKVAKNAAGVPGVRPFQGGVDGTQCSLRGGSGGLLW